MRFQPRWLNGPNNPPPGYDTHEARRKTWRALWRLVAYYLVLAVLVPILCVVIVVLLLIDRL
jgi:hypothetical protein